AARVMAPLQNRLRMGGTVTRQPKVIPLPPAALFLPMVMAVRRLQVLPAIQGPHHRPLSHPIGERNPRVAPQILPSTAPPHAPGKNKPARNNSRASKKIRLYQATPPAQELPLPLTTPNLRRFLLPTTTRTTEPCMSRTRD